MGWNGERWSTWLLVALVLTAASVPIQLHKTYSIIPAHWSDFASQWLGVRTLLHGGDPYTLELTHTIETRWFGGIRTSPMADSHAFVYPAHAAVLLWPFALLPWHAARILLTAILPPLVALTAWMWAKLCNLRKGCWVAVAFVTLSWPAIWAYQQTQLTVVVVVLLTAGCYALVKQKDGLAGVLFACSTMKPNLAVLLMVWVLLQMAVQHRWRFLIWFGATLSSMTGASLIMFPGWIPRWVAAAAAYGNNRYKPSLLTLIFGAHGGPIAIVVLTLLVLYRLWQARIAEPGSHRFTYAAALVLALTVCVIPATPWMIYNQLALIPAAYLVFAEGQQAARLSRVARLGIYELIGIVPLCAVITLAGGSSQYLQFLPFINTPFPPLLTVAVAALGFFPAANLIEVPAGVQQLPEGR